MNKRELSLLAEEDAALDRPGRNPDFQRRWWVVKLRVHGFTFGQIGRRLGVTRQAVHKLYAKAIKKYDPER